MSKTKKENNKDWKKGLVDIENKIGTFVEKKTPKLPESVAKFLVKYGPYLMLIALLFQVPIMLASVGLSALVPVAFLGGIRARYSFNVWSLFALIVMVLEFVALPGLFKKKISSWRLLFYVSLISGLLSLVTFQLGSLIIGTAICWYFLFQIKKYYE